MNILITGGAGFVGSYLAIQLKEVYPNAQVVALDNLKRRGSELQLAKLKRHGVEFIHGDIRDANDFDALRDRTWDYLIECSAEPSVHAGSQGYGSHYLIHTNFLGTFNCLEFCRQRVGRLIFLSTSRVYSIQDLNEIPLEELDHRFEISTQSPSLPVGLSENGIDENFSTLRARSLYGSSKLASEQFIQEYAFQFDLDAVINRCGVISGPGQWGKVDQGVYSLWVYHHYFGLPLTYTGFGGEGKQVRDLLHIQDLFELVKLEMNAPKFKADTFNVGGGRTSNTSLYEYTHICQEIMGKSVPIESVKKTNPLDMPYYLSNNSKINSILGWGPKKSPQDIVQDIHSWLVDNHQQLKEFFVNKT